MTWARAIKNSLGIMVKRSTWPFFTISLIPWALLDQIAQIKRPHAQNNIPDFSMILHQFIS